MNNNKIAVVGTGVMGEAIIESLLRAGLNPSMIVIRDKRSWRVEELVSRFKVTTGSLGGSQTIILAIKPHDLDDCFDYIQDELDDGILIVSLLAGVHSSRIERTTGIKSRVIRVMSNTPLAVGEGMSVIARGGSGTDRDAKFVSDLLSKSGETLIVEEDVMDAVTAVSGSGPAYYYGFVEAMIKAAIKLGLTEHSAKLLVHQTLIGAAKMVQESGKDAATLRGEVTSPNGTTAAALSSFNASGLEEIVYKAMKAAMDRSRELSN